MRQRKILLKQLRHVVIGMTLPVTIVFPIMVTLMIVYGYPLGSLFPLSILLFTWIKSWRNNARINYLIQSVLSDDQRLRIWTLDHTTIVSMDMRSYYAGVRACRTDIKNKNTAERDKANKSANADWRIGYTVRRITRWA
jgi:hypothetical protein